MSASDLPEQYDPDAAVNMDRWLAYRERRTAERTPSALLRFGTAFGPGRTIEPAPEAD